MKFARCRGFSLMACAIFVFGCAGGAGTIARDPQIPVDLSFAQITNDPLPKVDLFLCVTDLIIPIEGLGLTSAIEVPVLEFVQYLKTEETLIKEQLLIPAVETSEILLKVDNQCANTQLSLYFERLAAQELGAENNRSRNRDKKKNDQGSGNGLGIYGGTSDTVYLRFAATRPVSLEELESSTQLTLDLTQAWTAAAQVWESRNITKIIEAMINATGTFWYR